MKKIINAFKIATFLNLKLVLISLVLVLITVFGIKHINTIIKDSTKFSNKIIYNEKELLKVYSTSNELMNLNNKTLLLCVSRKYDSLSYITSVNKIRRNLNTSSGVNYKLDNLFRKKTIVFNIINEKEVDKEYLIVNSNELSLQVRVVLSEFYELKYNENLKEYKVLKEHLNNNLHTYIIIIILLIIIYSLLIILVMNDIKIKNRLESRDKYVISILIDRMKVIMSTK